MPKETGDLTRLGRSTRPAKDAQRWWSTAKGAANRTLEARLTCVRPLRTEGDERGPWLGRFGAERSSEPAQGEPAASWTLDWSASESGGPAFCTAPLAARPDPVQDNGKSSIAAPARAVMDPDELQWGPTALPADWSGHLVVKWTGQSPQGICRKAPL